mgnify:CR=1 FL=1
MYMYIYIIFNAPPSLSFLIFSGHALGLYPPFRQNKTGIERWKAARDSVVFFPAQFHRFPILSRNNRKYELSVDEKRMRYIAEPPFGFHYPSGLSYELFGITLAFYKWKECSLSLKLWTLYYYEGGIIVHVLHVSVVFFKQISLGFYTFTRRASLVS